MTAGRRCALPIGSAVRSSGSMGCNAVPPDRAGKRRKTGAGPGTFNAAASARASKRGMRWPSRKIPAPARGAVPTSLSRLQRFTDGLQTGIKIHGQRPWVYSWTGTFRSRWETSGKRRGKWMAPSARVEKGVESGYPFCSPVARGEGLGIGARGEGWARKWLAPSAPLRGKALLEGQEEILRGPESPANPCHSLPSPDRGDRGARPRFAPVAPPELERPYAVVSPVPGADAPRLRTVAPSELGDFLSPPNRKTCAGRRRTALRSRSRAGQRAEGSTAY